MKTNRDLDDKHRLGQKGYEREQIVGEDADTGRWQEEDVGPDRRDQRREQAWPAAAVPRGHDHRGGKKEERMVRAKPAEDVFDAEGKSHGRNRDPVADEQAHVTIHSIGRSIPSPLARVGAMGDRFPLGAARFLGALRRNNRKDWFDKHRTDYEEDVLDPAKEFVIDLGARLRTLRPRLRIDPRTNYGVKRINRDIRFSQDKKPYKDHQTLWWWEGGEKERSPGYWFDLHPKTVILAVGLYMAEPKVLDRYRQAVLDDRRGGALDRMVKGFERNGYRLEGPRKKRVPRGFDPDHPRARYLKQDGIYAWTETALPSGAFVKHCFTHYRRLTPLHEWLMELF